jgi:hypothetical protein
MTCVLDQLDVSTRALKRAQYEAFDFRLTDDGVTLRTGSHANPDEHVYTVTVAEGVPAACTCPADAHHEPACKHRLAVAIRELVLEAATVHTAGEDEDRDEDEDGDSSGPAPIPVADGAGVADPSSDDETPDATWLDDCDCPDDPGSFPRWPCLRDGVRAIPAFEDLLDTTDS